MSHRVSRKRFTYAYAYCETCDIDHEALHGREVLRVQAWARRHVLTTGHTDTPSEAAEMVTCDRCGGVIRDWQPCAPLGEMTEVAA